MRYLVLNTRTVDCRTPRLRAMAPAHSAVAARPLYISRASGVSIRRRQLAISVTGPSGSLFDIHGSRVKKAVFGGLFAAFAPPKMPCYTRAHDGPPVKHAA